MRVSSTGVWGEHRVSSITASYRRSKSRSEEISSSSFRPCSFHRASCRHASSHLSWSFWTSSTSCPFSFHLSSCRLSSCRLFSCHRASSDPASCRPVSSRPASYRRSERRQRGTRKEDGHELRNQLLHTSSWCDVAPESQTGAL